MALNDNSLVQYESAVSPQAFEAMTDSGDQLTFESSFSPWSRLDAAGLSVVPYGVATGLAVSIPVSGSNDVVDVSAGTAYMAGNAGADSAGLVTVSASTDLSIPRPATNPYQIISITVDSTGALVLVEGTEDAAAWSTTRGASGGPPLIPTTSIEIAQIHYSATASAPIVATEIMQVVGSSREKWNFPVWSTNYAAGTITFASALPTIHTGSVPKAVYVKGGTPIFAQVARAYDWVPAETTYTVNSTPTYDGPIGSRSTTINGASFSAILDDGITDNILDMRGEIVWVKFFQDRNKTPYQLTQGTLGVSRTFAVDDNSVGNFTVAPDSETADYSS